MNKFPRIILHIDMNCFFASCEMAVNEDLRGKPMIVAGNDALDRGLIVSPNYEARALGIKTTMHVKDAKRICPTILICEPHFELYQKNNRIFKEYLLKITNKVEMASIDEAYVDVTELNLREHVYDLAKKIQKDLLEKYKLPCSIGIAPNKLLAKMGSDYKKPLGITVIGMNDVPNMIWPLDIGDMMYIGKKTAPKLRELGINTIGDLANYKDIEYLSKKMGENFVKYTIPRCNGFDDSPVVTEYGPQSSYSRDHTYMSLVINKSLLLDTLKMLTNELAYDLQKNNHLALNIGIRYKDAYFQAKNTSKPLIKSTNKESDLFLGVKDVFEDLFVEGMGFRLVGVFTNRVTEIKNEPKQISIFDDLESIDREVKINTIVKTINKEIGKDILKKGIK